MLLTALRFLYTNSFLLFSASSAQNTNKRSDEKITKKTNHGLQPEQQRS